MHSNSRTSARRKPFCRPLKLESLQERTLMAGDVGGFQEPIAYSPAEQMMIEYINRARANPSAEATRQDIDLNQGLPTNAITAAPKAPLVPNASLLEASRNHSDDMLLRDYFAHTSPDGETPNDRAIEAGYAFGAGENIAYNYVTGFDQASVKVTHDQLFESAGHRQNLLRENYHEVGIGFAISPPATMFGGRLITTEKFGLGDGSSSLTGVVYDDGVIDDDFYSIGEGWGEVIVEAVDEQGQSYSTLTNEAGGYTLQLPAGQYQVHAIHPAGRISQTAAVVIADDNVKLDITADQFLEPTSPTEDPQDNNGDGLVTALDALRVINQINRRAAYDIQFDTNRDGRISPLDVLVIVNTINSEERATNVTSPTNSNLPTNSVPVGESNVLSSAPEVDSETVTTATDESNDGELADRVEQAKAQAASLINVPTSAIRVEFAEYVTYENNQLGVEENLAGQALTEGYQIILRYRTGIYDYRGTLEDAPRLIQYSSVNQFTKEDEPFCCPWETLGQHCLDAIDAAISEFTNDEANA